MPCAGGRVAGFPACPAARRLRTQCVSPPPATRYETPSRAKGGTSAATGRPVVRPRTMRVGPPSRIATGLTKRRMVRLEGTYCPATMRSAGPTGAVSSGKVLSGCVGAGLSLTAGLGQHRWFCAAAHTRQGPIGPSATAVRPVVYRVPVNDTRSDARCRRRVQGGADARRQRQPRSLNRRVDPR